MKNLKFKIFSLIVLTLFTIFKGHTQDVDNLVLNGGFEQLTGKLKRLGGIAAAEGWISPTGVPADLFSASSKMPDIQTPTNAYGQENPIEGDNYAGIVSFSYGDKMPRSYITSKLTTPLKKGMRYKVSFRASLAELSKYSANKLSVNLSKKPFSTQEKVPALIEESHVLHPEEMIFNAMYGWEIVCGEFVADGGERYITIGNFTASDRVANEKNKKPKEIKGNQIIAAYYYIDDVSVKLLNPDEQCECGYSYNEEKVEVSTIYQRSVNLTEDMSLAEKIYEQNIFYASGRYNLTIAGDQTIDLIVNLLEKNPQVSITIFGHADEIESGSFPDISMKRVEYIRSVLVEKNIELSRIQIADAKDAFSPPFLEETDEEKLRLAKCRRVSFKLN